MDNKNVEEEAVTPFNLDEMAAEGDVVNPQDQETEAEETAIETDQFQEKQEAPTEEQAPVYEEDENDKAYNFRRLREAKEREEERSLRLERELENLKKEKELQRQEEAEMLEDPIEADDYVEGKHLIKQRQQIKKLEKLIHKQELAKVPERLNNRFQDFEKVVTEENLNKIKQKEPEIYFTIMQAEGQTANGLYNKGVLAYKTLKRFGYGSSSKQPKSQNVSRLKDQAQENSKKPLSVNSLGKSPGSGSFETSGRRPSDEEKKRLYQEMMQAQGDRQ